jgi:hypothetical protein
MRGSKNAGTVGLLLTLSKETTTKKKSLPHKGEKLFSQTIVCFRQEEL